MRKALSRHLFTAAALAVAGLALSATNVRADGPVTSRMTTAKFALMKGWWSTSDHGTSTPINFNYMRSLMIANGITVDTFNLQTSQAPLTQVNLDKYDVIVWYNVYRMYEHFDSTTGNRIQRWYEGNKGLACFHQCVRSSSYTSGGKTIGWDWWVNMMGKDYNTYANTGATGPVRIDAEALGTVYDSTKFTAGQTFSWSDEWYTYLANPRGLPGTKMLWTTSDSSFKGVTFNSTMGNDHPLAWVRNYGGGRFSLNGMFHTTVMSTATGNLKAFIDSGLVGTYRFLAGYDGCKDPNYTEYNPKATHQPNGACATPTFIRVGSANGSKGVRLDEFKVVFSQPGSHQVEVFNTQGALVASRRGDGNGEYRFDEIRQPGIYYVRVLTADMQRPYSRKIILL